jgi:hypothetical protein
MSGVIYHCPYCFVGDASRAMIPRGRAMNTAAEDVATRLSKAIPLACAYALTAKTQAQKSESF